MNKSSNWSYFYLEPPALSQTVLVIYLGNWMIFISFESLLPQEVKH